jgi:capsular polysaccharide transport system permease protein
MNFAVRGASTTSDLLGGLSGIANPQRTQDALIIADYIRSRRMIEDIGNDIGLKSRYARSDVDWISRMNEADPIEDLVRYWRWKVDTKVDKNSGTVAVTVRAFTPEDALVIARGVADRSERLANELSERSRHDALRQAEQELTRAEHNMQATIDAMRKTRNEQGILDATKTAEGLTKIVGELRGKLLELEGSYEVQGASVSPSAPQMKILASRIANLKEQIAGLERRIAGNTGPATLADTQGALEWQTIFLPLRSSMLLIAGVATSRSSQLFCAWAR